MYGFAVQLAVGKQSLVRWLPIDSEKFVTNAQITKIGEYFADRMIQGGSSGKTGSAMLEQKYGTKVYSIITDEDVRRYLSCL